MMHPARLYLFASGCLLLVIGAVGLAPDRFLETNGWHTLGAVLMAVVSLAVAIRWPRLSAPVAVSSGGFSAVVLLLFAANAADQVLHAVLAVGGVTMGGWDLLAGRGLSGRARKTFLVLHIVAGAVWFCIDLALGILVVTALVTDNPPTAGMAVRAVELFAIWPRFAASLVCLGAGIVLAVGSRYGLLRYWWVAVKLGVNVLMSTLIVVSLRPGIGEAAGIGERLIAGDTTASAPSGLLFPVLVAPTLLLTAYLLSVFKPWGQISGCAQRTSTMTAVVRAQGLQPQSRSQDQREMKRAHA